MNEASRNETKTEVGISPVVCSFSLYPSQLASSMANDARPPPSGVVFRGPMTNPFAKRSPTLPRSPRSSPVRALPSSRRRSLRLRDAPPSCIECLVPHPPPISLLLRKDHVTTVLMLAFPPSVGRLSVSRLRRSDSLRAPCLSLSLSSRFTKTAVPQ